MHPVETAYRERTPGSAALQASAREVFPSGVTHDSRFIQPHGLYVQSAAGAIKVDVDGNEYVDYFGGHGALLLGHAHPEVTRAIHAALDRGTHFAAGHAAEIAWAECIIDMVPSAQRVRFTASGTEATQMAVRLARAYTGRQRLLRFRRHFHGWLDDMAAGYLSHFAHGTPVGVPGNLGDNLLLADQGDVDSLDRLLAEHAGEIAAMLVEPLGAGTGRLPMDDAFLAILRDRCDAHGILLIFDEVITGFRVSPGGVQGATGVIPDLTALAKIVAGGLPGGAVCGREDVMAGLDFAQPEGKQKVYHPGTFNANPVSAAAGRATLEIIARDSPCESAAAYAATLRDGLNDLFARRGVPWAAHGRSSVFQLFLNAAGVPLDPRCFDPFALPVETLLQQDAEQVRLLRLALMANGVDLAPWPGGMCSSAHDEVALERTLGAFDAAIDLVA